MESPLSHKILPTSRRKVVGLCEACSSTGECRNIDFRAPPFKKAHCTFRPDRFSQPVGRFFGSSLMHGDPGSNPELAMQAFQNPPDLTEEGGVQAFQKPLNQLAKLIGAEGTVCLLEWRSTGVNIPT